MPPSRDSDAPTDLHSLTQCSEVYKNYVPQFHYILFDLSQHSEEEFSENKHLQMAMMVLMYAQLREFKEKWRGICEIMREMYSEGKEIEDILTTVLTYLMSVQTKMSYEEIILEVENTLVKPGVTTMPTIAEQFIEKGRMQGIEQGIERGIEFEKLNRTREMIKMLLESRIGQVDERVSERLNQIEDLSMLENLFKQLASVTEKEELFKTLHIQ